MALSGIGYEMNGIMPSALQPFLLRFLAILFFVFCTPLSARAELAVGVVSKVTGQAQIGAATAVVGAPGPHERPASHGSQRAAASHLSRQ